MKIPLHELIRREIETRILNGTLTPGDRLPIEAQLMRDYKCSRMTVNKALSQLLYAGLIERRKRAGTTVARPRVHSDVHSTVLDIPDLQQDVVQRGQSYQYRQIARRIRAASPKKSHEVALAQSEKLLELRGIHIANGAPLALEERLISLATIATARDADFTTKPPGTWLLHTVPWTDAETRISAAMADAATAMALETPLGSPLLVIERSTWRGKDQVTSVRQAFLGNAYDLVARFTSSRSAHQF